MKRMSSRERLLAAIRHQEPDMVPNAPRIFAYLLEYYGCSCWMHMLQAAEEFGFDPVIVLGLPVFNYVYSPFGDYKDLDNVKAELKVERFTDYTVVKREIETPAGRLSDKVQWAQEGRGYGVSPNPHRLEYLIKGAEDVEKVCYLLPSPEAVKFPDYEKIVEAVGERGLVEVRPHFGVDHLLVDSLGLVNAMILYYKNRELLVRLLNLFHEYYKKLIKRALDLGAEVIFDSWYNFSLSAGWSPKILRELVFPLIKEDVDLVHSHGALIHYYDDGRIMPVVRDLKDLGIDVLSTLCPPPMGDVDLAKVKEEMGDRVCLKGNIDLHYVIKMGTPELIESKVKEAIQSAAPRGGFILSTSDSIRNGTPLEKVEAYFKAARKHGRYPIR